MSYHALVQQLEVRLKQYIDEKIATIVKYGAYSRSTTDGATDKIRGYQTEGADEQPYDFDGRRVFPFGIRSLPPTGTFGVWIGKSGRSGDGVIVGAESSRFGPSNLNDGEVCLYNKVNGTTVLLDQNGKVSITSASGQDIVFNGGSLQVARKSDKAIADTTMAAWISAISAKFNASAAPMTSAPGSITLPTDFGVINGGAANVKA